MGATDKPEIALLGATEHLGGHVARQLGARGYPIRAPYESPEAINHFDDVPIEWVRTDFDDPNAIRRALEGCMGVVDAGCYEPDTVTDIDAARSRGVGRLRDVLEACAQLRTPRFVYLSSHTTVGLGVGPEAVLKETDYYLPGEVANAYFEVKWSMEAEIYRYVREGLPATIVIPGLLLGPGRERPSIGARLLMRIARGQVPISTGAWLNVVDVRDVASTTVTALERGRPGRRYLAAGHNVKVDDLIDQCAHLAGVSESRFHLPAEPARTVLRYVEEISRRLRVPLPSMLVPFDLLTHGRRLSPQRAEAELDHQARRLQATIEDSLAWMRRMGWVD